ncbi:MAG TPA: prepilin peptidase [Bdellovibrionota bacterium]|nr:prepilin peptidase [Bdellovibrionota bacterium]
MIGFDAIGVILLGTVLFCAATDLVTGKIYNVVTFSIIGFGFLYHSLFVNGAGVLFPSMGIVLGCALFFPFFALGGMGAGDVKLLMAIGALKGWTFVLSTALYSLLAGGILSIVLLIYNGRFLKTMKLIWRLLWSLFVPHMKVEIPELKDCLMAPFGVPILCGVILTYFGLSELIL